MTTETVSATSVGDRTGYGALWRAVPRELGFLLPLLPIAVVAFSVTITVFALGAGLIVTFIGIFVLAAALYVARAFGTLELVRLRAAGMPEVTRPQFKTSQGGRLARAFVPLADGHYWLYLLHTVVVGFIISILTWSLTVTWVAAALGGLTFWFWDRFIPEGNQDIYISEVVVEFLFPGVDVADGRSGDAVLNLIIGVVFAFTLPFVMRGLVNLHHHFARGMLGAWRSEALERQVVDLSESRGAAISAEGHSLRRLERDIHDGPQQRLVRLQMDLASAERALEKDPENARTLIAEATEQSSAALDELRALSRGFAPPILMDRGLAAALQSMAARNAVPVKFANAIDEGVQLPQEIERNAYFIASELVTNATKHSGASEIGLQLALRRVPEGDNWWLDVTVADSGRGGAVAKAGHGLAGIEERLRGLGGTFEFTSPVGGPTVVTAHLPVTY
ncbi:sensor domain-containing protein [Diaminobutyricimonas sp. LJ205]|uniref:sensor histidine kinase n=1 Tax=Diaminobutyricimonas sp. LJ205 TaxID=2683590 RepID=UPI0012F51D5B|nr:sensor domain-containing protein [Diaminobutyricimonas sp. LJ205]